MENLLSKGTKCLIVQSEFSSNSFWNYTDVCKIAGAKYPAAPLGLITVAALLPQDWEFNLVDANVGPLLAEHFEWADIVCIGGMLPQQKSMIAIIDRAHDFGCKVVVGGPDPTSQPDLYKSADFLVLGAGVITIPMFLEDLANGSTSGRYKSEEMADMTEAVVPRYDLIRFQDYLQVGIQYSRGCPFNCEFCDIIELYGRKARTKTPEQVVKELQTLYDLGYRGHVDFVDDNFIGNKKNVKIVLPFIKEWSIANNYPYFFSTESSINLADDEKLMQMMYDVDFRFVFVGIESPDDEVLRSAQKKQNINKPIAEAVKKIYEYGMIVNGGFIVGFDNEPDTTADGLINCIQDAGICMAMVGKMYALPQTQLTKRLQSEDRLFEANSEIRDTDIELDQMTSGLNFITSRPRLDVLHDYVNVIEQIYDPKNYYDRIIYTGLNLNPANKYKPNFKKILKSAKAFSKVTAKAGFSKTTGWLYWKAIFIVITRNIKAIEAVVNLAAMYIHFQKQSQFIIDLTNKEIKSVERIGEENYNRSMFSEENMPLRLTGTQN